jgi:hypothetical protein
LSVFQRPDAFCVRDALGENFQVNASPAPNAPLDVESKPASFSKTPPIEPSRESSSVFSLTT